MALVQWSARLSVGIDRIDRQHCKLIDMLNELADAMKQGRGREALGEVLGAMLAYTQEHFATEEKLMSEAGYPAYPQHRLQHEQFIAKTLAFQGKHEAGKLSLSIEMLNFLQDWLVQHIQGADKGYGSFLTELAEA